MGGSSNVVHFFIYDGNWRALKGIIFDFFKNRLINSYFDGHNLRPKKGHGPREGTGFFFL